MSRPFCRVLKFASSNDDCLKGGRSAARGEVWLHSGPQRDWRLGARSTAMHPRRLRPPSPGANATGLWRGLAEALAEADCSSHKYSDILGRPPSFAGHARSRELRRDLAEAGKGGRALPAGVLAPRPCRCDARLHHGAATVDVQDFRPASRSETTPQLKYYEGSRGVAQPGSAPALGAGGRWFESSRPDQ